MIPTADRYLADPMTGSPSTSNPPTFLLLGPTAGGKTAVSIELARQAAGGGECIIADSMQVYADLVVGTAQPTTRSA